MMVQGWIQLSTLQIPFLSSRVRIDLSLSDHFWTRRPDLETVQRRCEFSVMIW
jgi:hypothetical protein